MKKVMYFGAGWCKPCAVVKPMILKVVPDVVVVDVDRQADVAKAYGVKSLPTILVMDNGVETHRFVGLVSERKVKEVLGESK